MFRLKKIRTKIVKRGVIFSLWNGKIQLEKRIEPGDKFLGYTLIPGGTVEKGENYEKALKREIEEEYGVNPTKFKQIGAIHTKENGGINIRRVYIVTKWEGKLKNVENRNKHINTSLKKARELCIHPISQQVLSFTEKYLSR